MYLSCFEKLETHINAVLHKPITFNDNAQFENTRNTRLFIDLNF